MSRRFTAALLVVPVAVALAGCTSSSGGAGGNSSAVSSGSSSSAPSTVSPSALADRLQSSLGKLTSAAFTLSFTIGAQTINGSGAEKFAKGKLTALQVTEISQGNATAQLIVSGGKTYAKLPASLGKTTKPWVLVSADSKNPVIKALAPELNSALTSASLTSVNEFVRAAKSIQDKGSQRVDGVPSTHYSVLVDVTKLSPPLQRSLGDSLSTLPLEIYLDSSDRPILYSETATLAGQKQSVRVTLSDFNKPVKITAPPASQVGTS